MASDSPTIAQVKKKIKSWQILLGIRDWTITVKWYPKDVGRTVHQDLGIIVMDSNTRTAEMMLVRPSDRHPDEEPVHHTIVHELVHILVHPLNPEASEVVEEPIINTITSLLLKLQEFNE